jgi:parallel beta-helix repeat protein
VHGDGNVIGGNAPEERNVLAGNLVSVLVEEGTDNEIRGNRIGTDATGLQGLGVSRTGVLIESAGNRVGGSAPGAGNVINSGGEGVQLSGDGADENVVQGNLIGTDADGDAPIGTRDGIDIGGEEDNPADGNVVQGNLIGVGANGRTPIPNGTYPWGTGIRIHNANHNTIGGTEEGAGNVIAHSAYDGIVVYSGSENAIRQNSIYDNGGLGIDLEDDDVTRNDELDPDGGANRLQNHPDIEQVTHADHNTTISWTLDSLPSTRFRLEFFGSLQCDASGWGEGRTFLGSVVVTTDEDGRADGQYVVPDGTAVFLSVTATATVDERPLGELPGGGLRVIDPGARTSTSEFSVCRAVWFM